jgi:hypothetical protein
MQRSSLRNIDRESPAVVAANVIIPTKNRPQWLSRCLRALGDEHIDRRCDVIVADDASSPLLRPTDGAVLPLFARFSSLSAGLLAFTILVSPGGSGGDRTTHHP